MSRAKLTIKYDLTRFHKPTAPLSISSFTVREVDGNDEEVAAKAAKAKGTTVYEELVRLSIAEVDGQPPAVPFTAYDTWNSRTRGFVLSAFRNLNGIDEKEEHADFLKSGQPQ